MSPIRAAFVMEQTLGHVTHARNLRAVLDDQQDVAATWLPIPFEMPGRMRFVPLINSNWSVRAGWRARRALGAALAAAPHDAVLFHTQVTALFSVPAMQRTPAIISLDATPINYDSVGRHYGHRPAGGGLVDRQVYRMNRRAFHAAAGLITWSEWTRDSLIRDYDVPPARISVLAPGAAPAYFDIGARRSASAQPSRPTDDVVRLLFVGGDFERKGGPSLLECMRGPLADRCQLHVVTQAPLAPRPNVYIHRGLGPNSPELLRLFAEADIFVLPSLADCLAVVLMEATAAGLPVITTQVGALAEAVAPTETGLLIPTGDTSGLYRALTTLVEDAERRRRMGRAGYALAKRKFHAVDNGRALLDLLMQTANAGRSTRRAA